MAKYFDEIIIRCDKNLRGRTADEIINLLKEGIDISVIIKATGLPEEDVKKLKENTQYWQWFTLATFANLFVDVLEELDREKY